LEPANPRRGLGTDRLDVRRPRIRLARLPAGDRYEFGSFTKIHAQLVAAATAGVVCAAFAFQRGLLFNAVLMCFIGWFLVGR